MTLIYFALTKAYETVNKELHYVNEWFIANKLNAGKTNYFFINKAHVIVFH